MDSKGGKTSSDYYTVSYKNSKNAGIATVAVKLKGNYSGTLKKTFAILPKGNSISKLSAKSGGFSIKWKKQEKQTTGYEIEYSTGKKFAKEATDKVTIAKNKTSTKGQKSKQLQQKNNKLDVCKKQHGNKV